MDSKTIYVSANCNQTPTAADCSSDNRIAYAACNAVLIYDPQEGSGGRVTHTLIGHTRRVNSVRWIRGRAQQLLSGATDGSLIVWALHEGAYAPVFVQRPGTAQVNIVDGWGADGRTIIACAPLDSVTLRIWGRDADGADFRLAERCQAGASLCVGLRLGHFPRGGRPVLACALDTSDIVVLVENQPGEWSKSCVLTGHEDWVRGLDFTPDDANGDLLLASGAQDCAIRIWRLAPPGQAALESVLAGHEGWIYSVSWHPSTLQLLSASIDKSLIIWAPDEASGLWLERARLGAVGGNTLGFYGAFFTPTGRQVVAHSYHGAFHIWQRVNDDWRPAPTVGGHFGEVVGVAWEPQGQFVYSASADQTVRVHAPWRCANRAPTWHEIARPQVHGYDLSSLAVIARFRYASGAEEKIVRTFQAPATFLGGPGAAIGATVPSLGLSNKAVDSKHAGQAGLGMAGPPTEETLLENTLWPEVQKLYGHGYEIVAVAASPDGRFLASSCKSSKAQHAGIFIWTTDNWQQVQQLMSHTLTVVQMEFSPDSSQLLSVSRDRRWSLFRKQTDNRFLRVATTDKLTAVHTRIIWSCAWTHDSLYFATGSRDGKLVLWMENGEKEPAPPLGRHEQATEPLEFPRESVTAVAFAPGLVNGGYLAAIGLESGIIEIFTISGLRFGRLLHLPHSAAHHLSVRRLAFRPLFGRAGEPDADQAVLQLCSGGTDFSVRIYDLIF